MEPKCASLRAHGMEDTLSKAFLRYQQQRGHCPCRDCVAKAKHFTIRVHKMLEVQSLYKPTPPHQPTAKRRRLRLTSVPLVDLRAPPDDGSCDSSDLYGSLNSPPRSLASDADATSLSAKSGICSMSESMDSQRLGTSSIRIKHLTSSFETESRFPKLNECAHFHYECVELGPIDVCLFNEVQENSKSVANSDVDRGGNFAVQVSSNGKSWVVRRSYENFRMLDRQLHQCIYDRKFSALPEIPKDDGQLEDGEERSKAAFVSVFTEYLQRFSDIAGNLINCGPILNWLELDNRGNRLIVTDDSAINTPAVAAAYVTKRYIGQATDEISFEVGDMISVIDMPPPEESIWWRGKRGFEVGFFPSECVEVIGDKVPHAIHIPKAPTKPVLRKHGKLIAFFRSFILSRPSRRKLKQSGILKERVFGCDLGEHLLNSGHDIPMVLKCCTEFIESHGVVDGIFRLSGVTSNIQKLRNTFDEDRVPDLNDEAILQDIHCVASLLKMYFRELPNPLLTYQLYDKFVAAVQSDEQVRLLNIRDVVQQLPPPHYRTLEYLVKHLARVAAHGAETGMTPKNVAIVWAPNLLRSKDLEVGGVAALQVVGVQAVVTEFLIHYSDLIFNDKMPAFPPCPGSAGTPRRSRPKSLAISTPTKLLSLEEARSRALGSGIQYNQKYIEVGGGPATLPSTYHTVIDLPDRKRQSTKNKKSPSGWKSFFSKGKSSSQSTRDREKNKSQRKPSSTPSDPGVAVNLSGKAITETDALYNNNRLRSVKSAESLISGAACSHRNSDVVDSGSLCIPFSGINGKSDQVDSDDVLSSSLGAVSSAQIRQSPHSHIRSISHDSYFEFAFDKRKEEKLAGELSTILSDDNDEDSERIAMEDFRDVATDLDLMKLRYVDQDPDSSPLGHFESGAVSTTLDETTASLLDGFGEVSLPRRPPDKLNLQVLNHEADTLDTLGSESLQEQLSLDFENGYCDIVGDIQKEVASALHWGESELESFSTCSSTVSTTKPPQKAPSVAKKDSVTSLASPETSKSSGKVVVERYGSEKTVIVEVHATEDSSADEEDCRCERKGNFEESFKFHTQSQISTQQDTSSDKVKVISSTVQIDNRSSMADSLVPFDSLEDGPNNLVSAQAACPEEDAYTDSLEYSILIAQPTSECTLLATVYKTESEAAKEMFSATSESLPISSETHVDDVLHVPRDNDVSDKSTESVDLLEVKVFHDINPANMYDDLVKETVPKILVRESTLPSVDDQHATCFPVNYVELNAEGVILRSVSLEPISNAAMDSDSSPGSQANSMDEISSSTSPSASGDPFGYSVLMNEEEIPETPVTEMFGETGMVMMDFAISDQSKETSHLQSSEAAQEFSDAIANEDFGVDAKPGAEVTVAQNQEMAPPSLLNICPMDAAIPVSPLPSPMSPSRDLEDSCIGQLRTPNLLLEKLSPVEESKRKFESEIGRDILRERKMKLEFEKIQLEQQKMDKTSPTALKTTLSDGGSKLLIDFEAKSPSNSTYRRGTFDIDLVELRQSKAHHESKRVSDPSSPQKENFPYEPTSDLKRHSEPGAFVAKPNRPERKASVRELMSKFERKPKIELPCCSKENADADASKALPSPSTKCPGDVSPSVECAPSRPNSIDLFVESQMTSSFDSSMVTSLGDSLTDSVLISASCDSSLTAKPDSDVDLISPSADIFVVVDSENSSGGQTTKVGDVARRERIDRYKEERRAQLRERIKSESFKGDQDLASDYLSRLKQKASSPTKLVSSSEDLVDFPSSPNRRSRLSAVSLGSPTESIADKEVFVNRRRSFNTRGSFSSATGSDESTPPVSPRKVAREKGCGLPIPPSSPRKLPAHAPSSSGTAQEPTEVSPPEKPYVNRPKELLTAPPASRKVVSQKKESPTDGTARKLKSPMKERTFNLPLSPTKDKLISIKDDGSCRKDFKGSKTSPVTEKAPSGGIHKSKIPKSGGPAPPPRKIRDVAAIFEPELQLGEQHPDNVASMKPKPFPKPAPSIVQRQMSLTSEDAKESSSVQRWKSKHPSSS